VAVLVAHLLGTRLDLGPWHAFADAHDLALWEDAAQAFVGDGWRGHHAADLSFFSFGTIKTATALGGGLVRVRDATLARAMRAKRREDPLERRRERAARLLRGASLKLAGTPPALAALDALARARGRTLDDLLAGAASAYPGARALPRLRRRPGAALLRLLERRLAQDTFARSASRAAAGEALVAALRPLAPVGHAARRRDHWVLAFPTDAPTDLVKRLRTAGFDATRRSSLRPVADDADARAATPLERLVILPVPPAGDAARRRRLATLVHAHAEEAFTPSLPPSSAARGAGGEGAAGRAVVGAMSRGTGGERRR